MLFLLPQFSTGEKFYYLPFRFFELGIGGLVGLFKEEIRGRSWTRAKIICWVYISLLVLTVCIGIFTFDFDNIGVRTALIGRDQIEGN